MYIVKNVRSGTTDKDKEDLLEIVDYIVEEIKKDNVEYYDDKLQVVTEERAYTVQYDIEDRSTYIELNYITIIDIYNKIDYKLKYYRYKRKEEEDLFSDTFKVNPEHKARIGVLVDIVKDKLVPKDTYSIWL